MKELMKPLDFVQINSDKDADKGLNSGDIVIIAGTRAFPVSEDDVYTQRVKFFIQKLEGDYINPTLGVWVVDPDSVVLLSEEENERLTKLAEERANATVN